MELELRTEVVVDDEEQRRRPMAAPADPLETDDRPVAMSRRSCDRLLRESSLGRIAYVVDGWPVVLPVNYAFDGADVIVRTDARSNLAALSHQPVQVALEVDSTVRDFKSGWSVLVHGMAEQVTEPDELARLRGSVVLKPWAAGERDHWIRIRVVQVTGRSLPERGRYPHRPT
jgi:nitroimidazol reductase NimA-like FMN-containing flavoprotein (pyridoxamine 5'-phosphate oxidase superfamily)